MDAQSPRFDTVAMEPSATPLVYIVEDDASVAVALSRLVRAAGLDARSFGSTEEFLAADIRAERACVVSDVRLPGISGLAIPELLLKAGKKLPVIIISGDDAADLEERALHAGATAFFRKPAGDAALLKAIFNALEPISREGSV